MLEKELNIINKLGLHARAAAKLVNTASQFEARCEIICASQTADAKSIMQVMMLAASQGNQVTVRTQGKDEQAALCAIEELINDYFGEGE